MVFPVPTKTKNNSYKFQATCGFYEKKVRKGAYRVGKGPELL
jgi:hypothetical protein